MSHHGINISRRDQPGKPRLSQLQKSIDIVPVGLGDDSAGIAPVLQNAGYYGRAEAGMVNVSIPEDIDEIELLYPALALIGMNIRTPSFL